MINPIRLALSVTRARSNMEEANRTAFPEQPDKLSKTAESITVTASNAAEANFFIGFSLSDMLSSRSIIQQENRVVNPYFAGGGEWENACRAGVFGLSFVFLSFFSR